MPVTGKYLYYGDNLTDAFIIRNQVFNNSKFNYNDKDEIDDLAIHVIVYDSKDNKSAVATGRVYYDGDNYRISKVAVLTEEQRKKYGDFTVRMLVNKAFLAGANEVIIDTPQIYVPFFRTIGFIDYETNQNRDNSMLVSMKLLKEKLCRLCQKIDNYI